ncbi:MAG: hypothetical protein MJH09_05360 [Cetobacterium sp.]|nr:hypothetical protein [Cetobacterium sp.]
MESMLYSEELIFFNLLKELLVPNLKNESAVVSLSLQDLHDKTEIDKQVISGMISKLQKDGLITFAAYGNEADEITLHFDRTHDKIFEFLPHEDLENILADINKFIFENMNLFTFNISHNTSKKYAKLIQERLNKNPEADINDLLRKGINELYSQKEFIIKLFKILYNIAKNANKENQELIEKIIYCFFNLPIDENPFITTLFLARISFELEMLKLQKGEITD